MPTISHYISVSSIFRNLFSSFYCAPIHIFRPPRHNTLARVGACAMLLHMAKPFTRGKTKPWGDGIRYPAHDHDPAVPLEDVRLEQFALLMARNAPMRRAVLIAFPNASAKATNYRAHKLMACKGVRERVEHLQAMVGLPVGQASNSAVGDVPPVASTIRPPKESLIDQTFLDEPKKRRDPQTADLTPAELRRIISEGARAGNSAAINAAIKMLDASLSAPPALVDPAAVCAVLFNGGGGGETLHSIILRLFDVFGAQAVIDCVSHNKSYVALNQSQGVALNQSQGVALNQSQGVAPQLDTKLDNVAQCGADSVQGGGVGGDAGRGADQEHGDNTRAAQAGGGDGEGGEPDRPSTYTICSENFEHENATKLRGKVPVIPKGDEEATSEA